jgi:hypothetical protein
MPRYHLRTWLFISSFHRDIAVRHIFHTVDIYFGEDQENLNRGLDIFDRAKSDPVFACRVKSLRLHWAYEEGDMLDLMSREFIHFSFFVIYKTQTTNTLFQKEYLKPLFPNSRLYETLNGLVTQRCVWIWYKPYLPAINISMDSGSCMSIVATFPRFTLIKPISGWHFDAVGVSAFRNLRKFTLRAEDDDGFADMGEVRTVLDKNEHTLRHLILGAYLARHHSWDSAFQSVTIKNLTHLDLVDTRISHIVLARIAHAHNLQSLTLHGIFEEPSSAAVVFASDHVIDGVHTFLPHLLAFRFVLVGHDDEYALYHSVTRFLRQRRKLRRLDLGSCPWELVLSVLPELDALRVLGVRIANLSQVALDSLVYTIPEQMLAISLSSVISEKFLVCSTFFSIVFLY